MIEYEDGIGGWLESVELMELGVVERDSAFVRDVLAEGLAGSRSRLSVCGATPWHFAAERGDIETLNALRFHEAPDEIRDEAGGGVVSGADVRDWERRTPMHYAAAGGRAETIELLARWGADIDPLDCRGRTPSHLGAWSKAALRALRRAGADWSIDDDRGVAVGSLAVAKPIAYVDWACRVRQWYWLLKWTSAPD